MTPAEILAALQTAKALYALAVTQFKLAREDGKLTEKQHMAIMAEAGLTDAQVDEAIAIAKARLSGTS